MVTKQSFGTFNGCEVDLYTLTEEISVTVCTLGATVLSIQAPNAQGNLVDVALGVTTAQDIPNDGYLGSVVGRCANRIAFGEFFLEGQNYQLDCNNGNAHLHGGNIGFNQKIYNAQVEDNSLLLTAFSPDGDQGYGGNLHWSVKYTVRGNTLTIEYFGETDKTTLFNPTNHLYFNLNGHDDGSILDNEMQVFADEYLEIDENLIPTVKSPVANTPFDFRASKSIGRDIQSNHPQILLGGGYDHNFCLRGNHVAHVYSNKTGITLDCYTDLPGVQFYSGNFLAGLQGKALYQKRSGFCLETQFYPNAINRDDCQKPILKRGEKFYSKTQYLFGVKA